MAQPTPKDRPLLGRTCLAAGLLVSFLLCLGPIMNPDLPWHLASGRQIAHTMSFPRQDFLSWTKAGQPWIDFEWATQLLYYTLDLIGGTMALWALKVAGFFTLTLLLTALLFLWELPVRWIALAAPAFIAALEPSVDLRPEIFSFLFFMAELYALEKRRLGLMRRGDGILLAVHAAIYSLWANLHAGFPTGLALCALYGLAQRGTLREKFKISSPLAWAAAGLIGTFLNPYGPRLYWILWDHMRHLRILSILIIEWGPPTFSNWYDHCYWLLLCFSLLGIILALAQKIHLHREHLFAIAVFGLLSSRTFRTTSYAALLVFPLSLPYWGALSWRPRWKAFRAPLLAAAVAFAAWRTGHIVRDEGFLRRLTSHELQPVAAADFLRREKAALSGLRLFNPWNWGGYLDYALYPDYRVFMDGRYIFTDLLTAVASMRNNPTRFQNFLDRQRIELVLMDNDRHVVRLGNVLPLRPFHAYAMPSPDWAMVYWDSQAMILVRRSSAPPGWLKRREYRLLRPHDLRQLGLSILSGYVTMEEVSAEISRYGREIGDPYQNLILARWLAEFRKGLSKSGG